MNFFQKLFGSKTPEKTDLDLSAEDQNVLQSVDSKIVVGKILTIRAHSNPEITKVRVTTCDLGSDEPVQILCGGTNIAEGQIVPIATVGAKLSEDFEIGVREIRGEASHGMICARSELGLSAQGEQKGEIWTFPVSLEEKLGVSICKLP